MRQLERFDFELYLAEYFPTARRSGRERIIDCIYCGKPGKLYVNVAKRKFFCFRCGAGRGATLFHFIQDHLGIDAKEALRLIQDGTWWGHTTRTYEEYAQAPVRHDPQASALPDEYESFFPLDRIKESVFAERALAYLRRRGVTDADLLLYQLGFCVDGKYQGRIIVPVLQDGEPVYFVARLFFGFGKRYLNPSNDEVRVSPKELLFNWDLAKAAPVVRITEGVFDAMALGEGAVALLGKQLHDGQRRLLELGVFHALEVWLDPDAEKDARHLGFQLRDFGAPVSVYVLPAGLDPNTATQAGDPRTLASRDSMDSLARYFYHRFEQLEASE